MSVSPGPLAGRFFLPRASYLNISFLLYRNSTSQPLLSISTRLQVPLSECLSSPSTVRQSKLPSRPELLTEFWSSSAPKSLTEEDFPPKLIPTHGQHCRSGTHQLQQAGDYDKGQRPQAHGANWRDLRSCAPSPASLASPLRLRAEHAGGPSGRWAERPAGGAAWRWGPRAWCLFGVTRKRAEPQGSGTLSQIALCPWGERLGT